MIKNILPFFLSLLIISCSERTEKIKSNSTDQLLDLLIQNSDGTVVEFPDLYKGPVNTIPEDKDEKLVLLEKLKAKGFTITDWGRGNYPPLGPRIINITLQKGNCECEVSKIYYSTVSDTEYTVAERIKCKTVR